MQNKLQTFRPETVFGKPCSGRPKQGPLASFDFENQPFACAEVCILNSIPSWKFVESHPHCGDDRRKMKACLTDTILFILLLMEQQISGFSQVEAQKLHTQRRIFVLQKEYVTRKTNYRHSAPKRFLAKYLQVVRNRGPLASFDFENQPFACAEVCLLNSILSWKSVESHPHCGAGRQKLGALQAGTFLFIF